MIAISKIPNKFCRFLEKPNNNEWREGDAKRYFSNVVAMEIIKEFFIWKNDFQMSMSISLDARIHAMKTTSTSNINL